MSVVVPAQAFPAGAPMPFERPEGIQLSQLYWARNLWKESAEAEEAVLDQASATVPTIAATRAK